MSMHVNKQKIASYHTVNSLCQLSLNLNLYKTFFVFVKNGILSVEKARRFGLRQTETACTKQ